jgi:hypothetical protein
MAMIDVGNINSLVSTFKSISSSLGSAFYAAGCGIVGSIGIIRIQRGSVQRRFLGTRTWSNTSATEIGFQRLLRLRLVSEERRLIARCYSGACCGLPMLARVSS